MLSSTSSKAVMISGFSLRYCSRRSTRGTFADKDETISLFFSLYIKLMLGPLSEDLSRIILAVLGRPGKDFFLLTARPIKKDRASLACSWTRLTIRGSCFEHRGIRTQGSRISFV